MFYYIISALHQNVTVGPRRHIIPGVTMAEHTVQITHNLNAPRMSHAWRRWCCVYKRVCILKSTSVYTHT